MGTQQTRCEVFPPTIHNLVLLVWMKHSTAHYAPVSINILREIAGYIPVNFEFTFLFQQHCLVSFNCVTKQTHVIGCYEELQNSLHVGGYTLIDKYHVIAIARTAILLDLEQQSITRLANLGTERNNYPGVVSSQGQIYAFGGMRHIGVDAFKPADVRKNGEFLTHLQGNWTHLKGKMSGFRSHFVPCVHQGKIYLCSNDYLTVDTCHNHHLSTLSLKLPQICDFTVVYRGEILFISENFTMKLNGDLRKHSKKVYFEMQVPASCMVFGSELYFLDNNSVRSLRLNSTGEILNEESYSVEI